MALRAFSRTIKNDNRGHFTVRAEARTTTKGMISVSESSRRSAPRTIKWDGWELAPSDSPAGLPPRPAGRDSRAVTLEQ